MFYVWWPLWPDLDLEPSLISNIYSISVLPYISGVGTRGKFWPKTDNFEVSTARKLKAPILTFDLTLTWHVTSFGKFRGWFRIVSSRAFERRIVRLSAAIRSRVMTWGRLTPPPPPASRRWRSTPANAGLIRPLVPTIYISRIFFIYLWPGVRSSSWPLHYESMGEILKSFPTHQ